MKQRLALLCLIIGALVGARSPLRFQPDPSSVIAAELAFNRLAQERGQWTAFRMTAADDAVMFMPQQVMAKAWLKGRADPPNAVTWTPDIVYVSCNGALAASTGRWTGPDGTAGYFTTIWRRDRKGVWRWILDHGDMLTNARTAPDYLSGKVATCRSSALSPAVSKTEKGDPPPPPDESLLWSATVQPDGARRIIVRMWTGANYEEVIDDRVRAGS